MAADWVKRQFTLRNLIFVFAVIQFVWLCWYYYTGFGGPQELVARVLSIALHPFLIGHPFRARYLEKALAHIKKHDAVWIATGSQILDWYKSAAKIG